MKYIRSSIGAKTALPEEFKTWKEYTLFLLNNLPQETANIYRKKFKKSIVFWRKKGATLDEQTISLLQEAGVKLQTSPSKKPGKSIVKLAQPTPDENASKILSKTPSWKRMCICILREDPKCEYMGF